MPDSKLHGKRQEHISERELDLSFWDIVIANIEELNDIKNYLEEKQLLLSGRSVSVERVWAELQLLPRSKHIVG